MVLHKHLVPWYKAIWFTASLKNLSLLCTGRLSFGCPVLDRALGHGVLMPGLTELVGTSKAGKIQLSLQICLMVQLPTRRGGLGAGVCGNGGRLPCQGAAGTG